VKILDGILASEALKKSIASRVEKMKARGMRPPGLGAILMGNDGASLTYVGNKVKMCREVGFESRLVTLPPDSSEEALLQLVEEFNHDPEIDGFIVQLPLPAHINSTKILEAISPDKDADGFHPANYGRMALNLPANVPATPLGIMKMLEFFEVPTAGKHCVVIGRSAIVGAPMSILMARNAYPGNCTVTLTHSKTADLKKHTLGADIIIAALGKPAFLTEDMVSEGAVVVDVGITRVPDVTRKSGYRIMGDVDFERLAPKCSFITPVPGGVGPMTVVALMHNTLEAALRNRTR
jgi:methylenetetrahydrofolate dehydrogenase (NADP+) / methenyltetrahydrofolate cyclohydrolase